MKRISLTDPNDFLIYREGSGGSIEITDIQVGSERRKGRGRKLIEALITNVWQDQKPKLIWAIARADNFIAAGFYSAMSFRVIGVLRNFYPEGDAVMYGREIP